MDASLVPADVRPIAPPRITAVVPCYDVATLCGAVVMEASRFADRIVAIDDGSRDGTGDVLRAAAARLPTGRLEVVAFPRNRGKGEALLEGFRLALAGPPFEVLVTIDGDGQHRAEDIPAVAAACQNGAGLSIGSRGFRAHTPLRSRIGNSLTAAILRRLYPRCPTDTQSGFRGHRHDLVEQVVAEVAGHRYETELHILLLALSTGRRVVSVPIPTIYIGHNESSHFRPLRDSWRIYRALGSFMVRRRGSRPGSPRPQRGRG